MAQALYHGVRAADGPRARTRAHRSREPPDLRRPRNGGHRSGDVGATRITTRCTRTKVRAIRRCAAGTAQTTMSVNSFDSRSHFRVGDRALTIFRLDALRPRSAMRRLPYTLRILLEMLLRTEDGATVRAEDGEALVHWDPRAEPGHEIAFRPARVLLQDFTGVPAIVDLAAMRDAIGG